MTPRPVRRWPLLLIGAPAAVSIWGGWVGLGGMAGFGPVHLLPGILPRFTVNTAITLPVGVEAYAAYALGAWLRPGTPDAARRFARWSAICALLLGMAGQVAYHLLAAWHARQAPWPVIVAVSCILVVALGFGAALAHLIAAGGEASPEQSPARGRHDLAAPLVAALAARIAPREVTAERPGDRPAEHPGDHPATHPADSPEPHPAAVPAGHPGEVTQDRPAATRPVPALDVARVRRKGALNATDDEVRAAIRELFADGKPVTPYRIRTALKGSKGGIGDGRATKLLAEVQAERSGVSAVR